MAGKKIIIIGAGLAGLASGIYARMNGYDAHIFEHGNQPGGVSATWKRKAFYYPGKLSIRLQSAWLKFSGGLVESSGYKSIHFMI